MAAASSLNPAASPTTAAPSSGGASREALGTRVQPATMTKNKLIKNNHFAFILFAPFFVEVAP
jgi:hypothetical protein